MRPVQALLSTSATAVVATVVVASPALAVGDLTVVNATFDPSGSAQLTLSASCEQENESVWFDASLRQAVGRFHVIDGWGHGVATCTGGTATATVTISGYNGKFKGGSAVVHAYSSGDCVYEPDWDYYDYCDYDVLSDESVKLSGGGK